MIHRPNYLDVIKYLEYMIEVKQLSQGTRRVTWTRLKHLLEWADDRPFGKVSGLKPAFPVYAEGLKNPAGQLYSPAHLSGMMVTCAAFFRWAKRTYPTRYRALPMEWIETLRPSRGRSESASLRRREIYTLEDIKKMIAVPAVTINQRRIRAGVAFLFLSGMRIGAFLTLPVDCVDLERMSVLQLPEKGVKTKNSKAAQTFLLNIPELLEVVREWDAEVRAAGGYWYAHLDHFGRFTNDAPVCEARDQLRNLFRAELVGLCRRAGVAYRSAHKLRHGFAVYALKKSKTVAQMKAVSQNLMHSNMGITDGIYGRLVDDDVRNIITAL